jgi:hypothetical protein
MSARQLWTENRDEIRQRVPWPAEEFLAAVSYLERAREAAG